MPSHEGGCICGAVRYETTSAPIRVTFCHCTFCQRATGGAYLVEPVFQRENFAVTAGSPSTYDHRSEGSGKIVTINFCATCGTKLFLSFERFTDVIGIFGGTFDDPNWFERSGENSKHIYLGVAQHGTVIPSGINAFHEYTHQDDGTQIDPIRFEHPYVIDSENRRTKP